VTREEAYRAVNRFERGRAGGCPSGHDDERCTRRTTSAAAISGLRNPGTTRDIERADALLRAVAATAGVVGLRS
jgi:hypothetical protein